MHSVCGRIGYRQCNRLRCRGARRCSPPPGLPSSLRWLRLALSSRDLPQCRRRRFSPSPPISLGPALHRQPQCRGRLRLHRLNSVQAINMVAGSTGRCLRRRHLTTACLHPETVRHLFLVAAMDHQQLRAHADAQDDLDLKNEMKNMNIMMPWDLELDCCPLKPISNDKPRLS